MPTNRERYLRTLEREKHLERGRQLILSVKGIRAFQGIQRTELIKALVLRMDPDLEDASRTSERDEAIRKLSDRWNEWTRKPSYAGRLTPNEMTALENNIQKKGYPSKELLTHMSRYTKGAMYHALANTLDQTQTSFEELIFKFASEEEPIRYFVYRYCIMERTIAVGTLDVRYNAENEEVRTEENYKTGGDWYRLDGYLVRQKDGVYRIFATHGSGSVQTITFHGIDTYSDSERDNKTRHLANRARSMVGAFFDRHKEQFFYAGQVYIHRQDAYHPHIDVNTYDKYTLGSIIRNRTLVEEIMSALTLSNKNEYPNLVPFYCHRRAEGSHD